MESLSSHPRAFVKSIVTVGLLSTVCFPASVATGLAGGTQTHASTAAYSVTNLGTGGSLDDTAQAHVINNNRLMWEGSGWLDGSSFWRGWHGWQPTHNPVHMRAKVKE